MLVRCRSSPLPNLHWAHCGTRLKDIEQFISEAKAMQDRIGNLDCRDYHQTRCAVDALLNTIQRSLVPSLSHAHRSDRDL
jgi:hypothetical protein